MFLLTNCVPFLCLQFLFLNKNSCLCKYLISFCSWWLILKQIALLPVFRYCRVESHTKTFSPDKTTPLISTLFMLIRLISRDLNQPIAPVRVSRSSDLHVVKMLEYSQWKWWWCWNESRFSGVLAIGRGGDGVSRKRTRDHAALRRALCMWWG